MHPLEALEALRGSTITTQYRSVEEIKLLPPLTERELSRLQAKLPAGLPEALRTMLRVSRGLDCGPFCDPLDLSCPAEQKKLPTVFAAGLQLARDRAGNFWYLEMGGPADRREHIWFICRQPAVVVFQGDSLAEFLYDYTRHQSSTASKVLIHAEHPDVIRINDNHTAGRPAQELLDSPDEQLRRFAASLPPNAEITDLRQPLKGDGFAWKRYGHRSKLYRSGSDLLFACSPSASIITRLWRR